MSGPGFFISTFDSIVNRNLRTDVAYSYKLVTYPVLGLIDLTIEAYHLSVKIR
jgi:hypothetical protein